MGTLVSFLHRSLLAFGPLNQGLSCQLIKDYQPLVQGLANYGPWPKLLPHFVNKILLERSHAFLFMHYYGYFRAISKSRREDSGTKPAKPQFFNLIGKMQIFVKKTG